MLFIVWHLATKVDCMEHVSWICNMFKNKNLLLVTKVVAFLYVEVGDFGHATEPPAIFCPVMQRFSIKNSHGFFCLQGNFVF